MKMPRAAGVNGSGAALAVISLGSVLALWQIATSGQNAHALFPSPGRVAAAFVDVVQNGYLGAPLAASVAISLQRLIIGWVLCLSIGVALGFAMHFNRIVRESVLPWLAFYRPLPPLAYLSLLVLWLGVGETSKVVLLVLAGLPPLIIGTYTSLAGVREERVQGARSIGLSPWQMVRLIYAPSVAPAVLVSARIAFGACFAALIGAEMIASSSGVAWMIIAATNRSAIDVVIVGVVIMAAIALVFDYALRRAQQVLVPWAAHEQ
ncbi:MAG: ABC transporter permease [Parvibaculaceae bacterium]